ncbi:MAG TPA: hypothetical protein VFT87_05090 [Candidatus Saccharimonadales bacterium]|nr:hypothetical protein [Candidatus Saccharimonadales bacterium]
MMKRADLLALAKDRMAIILLLTTVVSAFVVILVSILRLHASDVQIPIRYSAFGTANIYRDQWYVLYIFPLFALLITAFNAVIAVKLYNIDRLASLGFMGLTIFLLVTCLVVVTAILNLAPTI